MQASEQWGAYPEWIGSLDCIEEADGRCRYHTDYADGIIRLTKERVADGAILEEHLLHPRIGGTFQSYPAA